MTSKRLNRILARTWTTKSVAARFQVTTMTIHNWREDRGLPALIIPPDDGGRPAVRYLPQEIRAWSRRERQPMANF